MSDLDTEQPASGRKKTKRQNPRRSPGRPRGGFLPKSEVDWVAIEKSYIYGDEMDPDSADPAMPKPRRYPSIRELAERHGVHPSRIGQHSSRYGWLKRRKKFQEALDEETDRAVAKAAALSTADAVGLIDSWVSRFEANLREKRVRADNVSDLNTIMRLREFLLGNADSRAETSHTLTLDTMQERFRKRREERAREGEALEALASAALAGVIVEAAPSHVLDVAAAASGDQLDPSGDQLDPEPAKRERKSPPNRLHEFLGSIGPDGGIAGNTEKAQSIDDEQRDIEDLESESDPPSRKEIAGIPDSVDEREPVDPFAPPY